MTPTYYLSLSNTNVHTNLHKRQTSSKNSNGKILYSKAVLNDNLFGYVFENTGKTRLNFNLREEFFFRLKENKEDFFPILTKLLALQIVKKTSP